MKKKVILTVFATVCALICAVGLFACADKKPSGGKGNGDNVNGTYYLFVNGDLDKNDYIKLDGEKWFSSGNESGIIEKTGNAVMLYISFFGEKTEYCGGVVNGGIFRIDRVRAVNIDYKYYCKTGYAPASDAPVHNLRHTQAKAPDCVTDGNVEYWTCIACGSIFGDANGKAPITETNIKSNGHSFGEWETDTSASCLIDGRKKRTCGACKLTEYDTIPSSGHKPKGEYGITNTVHWQVCEACGKHAGEFSHKYDSHNVCVDCGHENKPHENLKYELSPDETFYYVYGWDITDTEKLILPSYHDGKPVKIGITLPFNGGTFKGIVLSDGMTDITPMAFGLLVKLKYAVIPQSVQTVGMSIFQLCEGLTDIWCEAESQPSGWNSGWKNYAGSAKVHWGGEWHYVHGVPVLKSKVDVDEDAHEMSQGFQTDEDYHWHTAICGHDVVTGKSEHDFDADDKCRVCGYEIYYSYDELLLSGDAEYAVVGVNNAYRNVSLISIPHTYKGKPVTSIAANAFKDLTDLEKVIIPKSIKSIGEGAFSGCTSLKTVTIGDGVTSIGNNAFGGCDNITTVTMPTTVIPFIPKTNLETVVINGGENIVNRAFYNCSNLTSIEISDSVTSIGGYAFGHCSSLKKVRLPNKPCIDIDTTVFTSDCPVEIATIPTDAILHFPKSKLQKLIIDGGRLGCFIYNNAFENCGSLSSVELSDVVTGIGDRAFSGCSSLTRITIGNGVTSIGNNVFSGCSSLTSITIPNSVTSIGDYVFSGCNSLQYNEYANGYYLGNESNKYLVLVKSKNASITTCMINENTIFTLEGAFQGCRSLTSVTIPNSVVSIRNSAFYGCSSLTSITIPNSVTSIGYRAFYNCSSLTSITIPNNVTSIGDSAFYGCSSLTSITIPNNVTSIGDSAFANCTNLTSIEISNSVTIIGSSAFVNCTNLTSITIPNSVTSIGDWAFSDCSNLTSMSS